MIGKPPTPAHTLQELPDYAQRLYQWTIEVYRYLLEVLKDKKVRRTATDYITTVDDRQVGVTDTTVPRTVTIASAAIAIEDFEIVVNDESGGAAANNITVATEGAETINGAASVAIAANYGSVRLRSDGTNLFAIT
jgi:hypothetical protein